jgi:hypothetical protein
MRKWKKGKAPTMRAVVHSSTLPESVCPRLTGLRAFFCLFVYNALLAADVGRSLLSFF